MQFNDFRSMIDGLARDVPPEFRGGVVAIEVSPKTVPHPLRGDVYTLGECIPLEWSGSGADLQSRIVLYHGSFAALARLGDFEWREEAWETLVHELRHHLEWRANAGALEAYDWAAEENFKRHEGQPFDPVFYRSGERIADGVYKVDDDVFIERDGGPGTAKALDIVWHGRHYRVPVARSSSLQPIFLALEGLAEPPPGEAVVVLRRKASLFDLFRRTSPPLQQTVTVEPLDG
ncbi:MAG: metallopeptidase family protein [Gemmatimonadales bacterium]